MQKQEGNTHIYFANIAGVSVQEWSERTDDKPLSPHGYYATAERTFFKALPAWKTFISLSN